jgi:GNAT superfamily N-acetyltransferase
MTTTIHYRETHDLPFDQVIELYQALHWSSARKGATLMRALANSHSLISAWDGDKLVGLGNAISDGYLVVYYPHLLVLPEYQGHGIGREIVRRMQEKYRGLHQQSLIADGGAIEFYKKCGFVRAGRTEPMWIFAGDEH